MDQTKFARLPQELYQEVFDACPSKLKPLLDYIYRSRICTIDSLLDKFPELADSCMDMLAVIGKVNGRLFTQFKVAIYPAEVAPTIQDSAYSLGLLPQ